MTKEKWHIKHNELLQEFRETRTDSQLANPTLQKLEGTSNEWSIYGNAMDALLNVTERLNEHVALGKKMFLNG